MRRIVGVSAVAGALLLGFWATGTTGLQAAESGISEQWVNPNLVRIYYQGKWQDVPLVPLADHLCEANHPMFRRYCKPSLEN